ncbi:hypothetical protein CWB96_00125 [Pseudoalteromonas citrea]|uniref:Uncharacterized protein n=1 Tax=Pseudoalteromonas citrea TaxID=43655 RepID=A0A5S3XV66_9GAMM|nr:hypothetical protein [Pseudoalteromonas citrea]TMP46272.1 hypothetical protein CWB97_02120 [Pseudoalteromonas citrea]TMP63048.1 hypothetical protein CWB96_00125 [Pseudoalteromonas citrea]
MKDSNALLHTIEQTGENIILVSGLPSKGQLASWLKESNTHIYCLFPSSYKSEQTQVKLRSLIKEGLLMLNQTAERCSALVLLGGEFDCDLKDFPFGLACEQVIEQFTPRSMHIDAGVEMPQWE